MAIRCNQLHLLLRLLGHSLRSPSGPPSEIAIRPSEIAIRSSEIAIRPSEIAARLLEHDGRLRSLEMHDLLEGRRVVVGVPIELGELQPALKLKHVHL